MPEIDDATLASLTTRAEAADSAIAAATDAAARADAATAALGAGVTRYAETVRTQNPDIPAEAIAGDTFDAIDAAQTSARAIATAAVAAAAANKTQTGTIPAGGANTRDGAPSGEGLSPGAKIAAGLTYNATRAASR